MISVLTCVGTKHDPWLVLLAAMICFTGSFAAMRLFSRGIAAHGAVRQAWTFLAALVAGGAIWCTHIIAMLAFMADAPVAYDPVLTIASLIVGIGGTVAGLSIAALDRPLAAPAVGGAVMGVSITAMHYAGMLAYHVGAVVRWRRDMVTASGLLAVFLASLAMVAVRGQMGARLVRYGTPLLIGAVLALHFTGMAALDVIPVRHAYTSLDGGPVALAIASATVAMLIILAGGFAYFIDDTAQRSARAQISAIRQTDLHTGLPNRASFVAELAQRLTAATAGDRQFMATIKLENFGAVVERYGIRMGDLAIKAAVARMLEAKRPGVFLAQTGRAEFAMIGPASEPQEARARAQMIATALTQPILVELVEIAVDARMGLAHYPADATQPESLMACSRLALNRALCDPLERVGIYDEGQDSAARRRQILASDLRFGLLHSQFELHFQPQVRTVDRIVVGQEALLRWDHPQLGKISPVEFIALAEQTGDILAIGDWALQTACTTAAGWPADWHVAVNVSPLQLRQPDLPQRILAALVNSGLSPHRLEIELTESLLVDDRDRALHVLRAIRAIGVSLSLDDFGTGFSSLDVLRHFPFDKIKLDKSFVDDVRTNLQSRAILHAVLEMGRSLDIPMLAEGVETEDQMVILRAEGCNNVQGYLTGRPVPAGQVALPVPLSRTG